MKINVTRLLKILLVSVCCLCLSGCFKLVAEQPGKTQQQYLEDKTYCEKRARNYARILDAQIDYVDEVKYARQCMKGLGWEYHYKLLGSSPEKPDQNAADQTSADQDTPETSEQKTQE